LTSLQTLVNVTAAAIPILEAANVPIPPSVPAYVGDVAQCIANATSPTPAQLVAIGGCLASKVAPTLGPGIPDAVVTIISQIAADVAAYLAQHPPATTVPGDNVVGPTPVDARTAAQFQKIHVKALMTAQQARALALATRK
jgi:hypothetical protein